VKRPFGITVLCLVLGWLTLAGAGNAFLMFSGRFEGVPPYLGAFAAAYTVAALIACTGLWQMKAAGLYALRAWMGICVATLLAMIPSFAHFASGGIGGILGFVLFIGFLFWLLHTYVSNRVKSVA
jgi:hypothetical protein